jgi:hypothetical protein
MTVAFVTALYSLREGYSVQLTERFQQLLDVLPADCLIYVWSDLALPTFSHTGVRQLNVPVTDFEVYRLGTAPGLRLPPMRTPEKDTAEYMSLMNTKLEMLNRVVPHLSPDVETLAWVDCGVSKIWKDADRVRQTFARVSRSRLANSEQMVTPGCWPPKYPPHDKIYWRFCGGFFLVSVTFINTLFALFLKIYKRMLVHEQVILWELNVWAILEYWYPSLFGWYYGEHDETLFEVPSQFLTATIV